MEKPIMIPAAAFFDPLFQNNAKGANCAIITKDTKPMETNVYSKAKIL
jgi:hypothetical protein